MTNQELFEFFSKITVLCIGCGEPARFLGEWPVQYHQDGKERNFNQALRWTCGTCRLPAANFKPGYCIGVAMIVSPEFNSLRYDDASSSDLSTVEASIVSAATADR